MFTGLNQVPGFSIPQFETRKALLIVSLQNDSLYVKDDLFVTKNHDFVHHLREMIPYFRKHGDVVWVKTEMGVLPSVGHPNVTWVEAESAKLAEKNREERRKEELLLQDDTSRRKPTAARSQLDDPEATTGSNYQTSSLASSRAKEDMTHSSADNRAEKRSAELAAFDGKDDPLHKYLSQSKPRKGQQARFYVKGTRGVEICDELLDVMDSETDLVVTKHHYSAFEETSLLISLRMNLVTEIYLCGCLTNVGVYSTAADAVQHGLQVTVVEDCLGYRSEEKHQEALRQMAELMGVHGITSDEIIEESGGRPVPDAQTPGITLEELDLNADKRDAGSGSIARDLERGAKAVGVTLDSAPIQPVNDYSQQAAREEMIPDLSGDRLASSPRKKSSAGERAIRSSWKASRTHTLGPNDSIGSGDSRIIYDVLSSATFKYAFDQVKGEVDWHTMSHRGGQVPRLVAAQGEIGENNGIPIYRHPADESPPLLSFTPTVQAIRQAIEGLLNQPFNHALIQLYRDGIDNISEHSDKTLDLVRGSNVVNVSLGAQRTLTLRTKKSAATQGTDNESLRQSQRIPMPHNSIFVLGPQTNREWLHGVRADKRPDQEKTSEEMSYGGERISITFRQIGTFINEKDKTIWGSGARNKAKIDAGLISTRDSDQMEAMIQAFGKENHLTDFDWDAEYGLGFDVVNLVQEPAKLVLCNDTVANLRVRLSLCEKSVAYTTTRRKTQPGAKLEGFNTRPHPWAHGLTNSENPTFRDVDESSSENEGDLAIMFYLEKVYPSPTRERTSTQQHDRISTRTFSETAESNELLSLWRELRDRGGNSSSPTHRFSLERPLAPNTSLLEELHSSLGIWEAKAGEAEYMAGNSWTIIDCAFWPVFNEIINGFVDFDNMRYQNLLAYHHRILERDCVQKTLKSEE